MTGAAGRAAPVRSWYSSVTDTKCQHLAGLEMAPLVHVWMATSGHVPLATALVRPRSARSRTCVGQWQASTVQMPGVCTEPRLVTLALSHSLATLLTISVISCMTAAGSTLFSLLVASSEAEYLASLLLKLPSSCPFVPYLPIPGTGTTVLIPTVPSPFSFLYPGA